MSRRWLRVVGRTALSLALLALVTVLYIRHGLPYEEAASISAALQTPTALGIATWLATLFSFLSFLCEALSLADDRAETRRKRTEEEAARQRFLKSFDGHSCIIEDGGTAHHFIWDGEIAGIPDRAAARPAESVLNKLLARIEYLEGQSLTAHWDNKRAPDVAVIYETDAERTWKSAVFERAYGQTLAVFPRKEPPRPKCPTCGLLYTDGTRECPHCHHEFWKAS